jgi:hypothetical protein
LVLTRGGTSSPIILWDTSSNQLSHIHDSIFF